MSVYTKTPYAPALLIDLGSEENTRQMWIHTLSEASPLFRRLHEWMSLLDYSHEDRDAVRVALREAIDNALHHGNGDDPNNRVRIRYLVSPAQVLIEVRDQGQGFPPTHRGVADQGQRHGIERIYNAASWVSYNLTGNQVTFCRCRTEQ
jgi:anti-sigma regulatory factor (Ser/Thr protein kinase)